MFFSNATIIKCPLDDLDDEIENIPKDENVYVVCQTGGRSKNAIIYLQHEYGFENLINVKGGLIY